MTKIRTVLLLLAGATALEQPRKATKVIRTTKADVEAVAITEALQNIKLKVTGGATTGLAHRLEVGAFFGGSSNETELRRQIREYEQRLADMRDIASKQAVDISQLRTVAETHLTAAAAKGTVTTNSAQAALPSSVHGCDRRSDATRCGEEASSNRPGQM